MKHVVIIEQTETGYWNLVEDGRLIVSNETFSVCQNVRDAMYTVEDWGPIEAYDVADHVTATE